MLALTLSLSLCSLQVYVVSQQSVLSAVLDAHFCSDDELKHTEPGLTLLENAVKEWRRFPQSSSAEDHPFGFSGALGPDLVFSFKP